MVVTKDTMIGELLNEDMNTARYLMEMGMHCVGCPASAMETLEEACAVHGTDVAPLVEKINDYFSQKN